MDAATILRRASRSVRTPQARGKRGADLFASTQRYIQPTERVDSHPIAGADDNRRGFGFDDRRAFEGVAGLERIKRINGNLAPAAEKGLLRRARRTGGSR